MAFTMTSTRAGSPSITSHDTPATVETVGSTTVTDVQTALGTIIRAKDATYGEGEFIRLLGVGSTVVGDVVLYNATTYQTTRAVGATHKNSGAPVAVAMSACVAGEHGWYQIGGLAVIKKTAVTVSPQVPVMISATAGRVKVLTSAGQMIVGARSANLATVTSTTSTVIVNISRPHIQGQIT